MAYNTGKPKGYVKYLLGMDCETTGLCFSTDSPVHNPKTGEQHQAVSWGLVVLDSETLEQVDQLYVEIQWNDLSKEQREDTPNFGTYAEKIHGLSKSYLEENGLPEEEAIVKMYEMIGKYWGPTSCISCLGHNVHLFDLPFFRDLFRRNGIELKFGSRHVDTHSLGLIGLNTYTSDQAFEMIGYESRGDHNALDDVKMSIDIARTINVGMKEIRDKLK